MGVAMSQLMANDVSGGPGWIRMPRRSNVAFSLNHSSANAKCRNTRSSVIVSYGDACLVCPTHIDSSLTTVPEAG